MKRQSWEQVKKGKERLKKFGIYQSFQNAELMKKAENIAEKMLEHEFVLNVGVFGSTARGEAGRDIDLIIVDDGTISDDALSVSKIRYNFNAYCRFSAGTYGCICHDLFMDCIRGGTEGKFFEYLYGELPYTIYH